MSRLFIFIVICSPCIALASHPAPIVVAALSKRKKLPGMTVPLESLADERTLAQTSKSPVSGTNSPETGSLRRPGSRLTYDSGAVTPTDTGELLSATATPVPSLQSRETRETASTGIFALLFADEPTE
jgi:hypothetical protein